MKTLFITAAVLFSTFAEASQPTSQKVLGECVMTKASILKSKHAKKGSIATNEVVRFVINAYIHQGSDAIYDQIKMDYLSPNPDLCPTLGCEYSDIAYKSYDNPADAPMLSAAKFKVNTGQKVEVLFQTTTNDNRWTKLTYDFVKKVGTYESREKINDWGGIFGVKTTTNDHFVREIRNCTFTGPLNLNPNQK